MKNWQIMGVLTFLIIGIVLMSGCTSTGSKSEAPVTPTPTSTVTLIPTRTFTSTTTPSPTPVLKTVLFSDDLSQWRNGWDSEYDGRNGKVFYSGGSLHIRNNNPPFATIYQTLNKNFNDFILDVDAKTIDGTLNNWLGVNVRSQDEDNYYGLSISADGYYAIVKFVNGNKIALSGPIRSSYINTGLGATNHIHCEVNKNTLSLSVNNQHISTVTDNAFKDGKIELKANSVTSNSFTEVVYNNLVITSI